MENSLAIFGDKVVLLSQQLRSSSLNLSNVPHLLSQIITERMWKKFEHPSAGQIIDNSTLTFDEFIFTQPPKGLGGNLKALENILLVQSRSDNKDDAKMADEALKLFVFELAGKAKVSSIEELPESLVDLFKIEKKSVSKGTQSALRKLEKERTDLYQKVIDGEMSAHRAMIEAGFRKRRFSMSQGDIHNAARALKRNFSEDEIESLIVELTG